jgi:hypothetical protein
VDFPVDPVTGGPPARSGTPVGARPVAAPHRTGRPAPARPAPPTPPAPAAWPELPGRAAVAARPAWLYPDPDPSRWPALPDDSPLWTNPGRSIAERHLAHLDAEQAGR